MSDHERSEALRIRALNEKKIFERSVIEGHVTREVFGRIKDEAFTDGQSVNKFVEFGITDKRFRWNEDHLEPDYENFTDLSLSPEVLKELRTRSLDTGEMPGVILTEFINNSFGVTLFIKPTSI